MDGAQNSVDFALNTTLWLLFKTNMASLVTSAWLICVIPRPFFVNVGIAQTRLAHAAVSNDDALHWIDPVTL